MQLTEIWYIKILHRECFIKIARISCKRPGGSEVQHTSLQVVIANNTRILYYSKDSKRMKKPWPRIIYLLNSRLSSQWHVGQRRHVRWSSNGDLKSCFEWRVIKTGKSATGIRRWKLSARHNPENSLVKQKSRIVRTNPLLKVSTTPFLVRALIESLHVVVYLGYEVQVQIVQFTLFQTFCQLNGVFLGLYVVGLSSDPDILATCSRPDFNWFLVYVHVSSMERNLVSILCYIYSNRHISVRRHRIVTKQVWN